MLPATECIVAVVRTEGFMNRAFFLVEGQLLLNLALDGHGRFLNPDYVFEVLRDRSVSVSILSQLAAHHRLEGLLYSWFTSHRLPQAVPGKYLILLNQKFESNALRNLALLRAAAQVTNDFDSRSIDHAFLKGLSPTLRLSSPLGIKSVNDLDLLVLPGELPRAIDRLVAMGYVYGEYDLLSRRIVPQSLEDVSAYLTDPHRHHHLRYPLTRLDHAIPGSAVRIELHVSCAWRNAAKPYISSEALLESSDLIEADSTPYRAVSSDADAAVLALQFYHDFFSLWDVAVRNKDFELFRLHELASVLSTITPECGRSPFLMDHELQPILSEVQAIISHLANPNLCLLSSCPERFCQIGLECDGMRLGFKGTNFARFIAPEDRYNSLGLDEIRQEVVRREEFWRCDDRKALSCDAIRQELLQQTFSYVSTKSPFYRQIAATLGRPIQCLDDLPSVTKNELREHGHDFICNPDIDRFHAVFTGSTTAKPLLLFRSTQEIGRVEDLFLGAYRDDSEFTLQLHSGNHGAPTLSSIRNGVIAPVRFCAHFEMIHDFLSQGVPTPSGTRQVTLLIGGLVAVKRFVTFVEENHLKVCYPGLQQVVTSGTYLTRHWRRRLEQHFQVRVRQMFGLSEFTAGLAYESDMHGCYHFPITVYASVVGAVDIPRNIGELELSHLFPFVELQPVLRYRTGDVVRDCGPTTEDDDRAYRFLGRISTVPFLDRLGFGTGLIPISALAEVIEEWGHCCYRPDTANAKGIIRNHRLCNAVARFTEHSGGLEVTIECDDAKLLNARTGEYLLHLLLQEAAEHSGCLVDGAINCRLVKEGELRNEYVRY
jgi:hypothetical protein